MKICRDCEFYHPWNEEEPVLRLIMEGSAVTLTSKTPPPEDDIGTCRFDPPKVFQARMDQLIVVFQSVWPPVCPNGKGCGRHQSGKNTNAKGDSKPPQKQDPASAAILTPTAALKTVQEYLNDLLGEDIDLQEFTLQEQMRNGNEWTIECEYEDTSYTFYVGADGVSGVKRQ